MNTTSQNIVKNRRKAWLLGLGLGVAGVATPQIAQASSHSGVLVAEVNLGVNVDVAPPPPRDEVIVERDRPSRDHVWVKGYWAWRDGHHVWVAGHWERPPRAHATWIEPRWERRGHGYVFIDGYWH